jgi:hypothetical protein
MVTTSGLVHCGGVEMSQYTSAPLGGSLNTAVHHWPDGMSCTDGPS